MPERSGSYHRYVPCIFIVFEHRNRKHIIGNVRLLGRQRLLQFQKTLQHILLLTCPLHQVACISYECAQIWKLLDDLILDDFPMHTLSQGLTEARVLLTDTVGGQPPRLCTFLMGGTHDDFGMDAVGTWGRGTTGATDDNISRMAWMNIR